MKFTHLMSQLQTVERGFVFRGNPDDEHNPGWLYKHGYQFHLNGKPTMVTDDVAAKLATHTQFTER